MIGIRLHALDGKLVATVIFALALMLTGASFTGCGAIRMGGESAD